jgi:hypothetical protein
LGGLLKSSIFVSVKVIFRFKMCPPDLPLLSEKNNFVLFGSQLMLAKLFIEGYLKLQKSAKEWKN